MLNLNTKGQAFSVFKLLIAAVVAVVILTLLLSIIGRINIFGQGVPQTEAGKIVNDLVGQRGVVRTSDEVIFNPNVALSNKGIADATKGSLNEEQVCVLAGDFEDDQRFNSRAFGRSVIYEGSTPQNATVIAICDTGSAFDNYRGDYFYDYTGEDGIQSNWASGCDCVDSDFRQTCCVVAIKRYRG